MEYKTQQITEIDLLKYVPKHLKKYERYQISVELLTFVFEDIEAKIGKHYHKYMEADKLSYDEAINLIREFGYTYIADLLSTSEPNKIIYLLALIQELKGSREGLEFILDKIFNFRFEITEWFEATPPREPFTYTIVIDLNNSSIVSNDLIDRIQNFLREYIYAINDMFELRYSFNIEYYFDLYGSTISILDEFTLNGTDQEDLYPAPAGLTATPDYNAIILNWTAYVDADSFNIYSSMTGEIFDLIDNSPTNSYTHMGLFYKQPYYYRISAIIGGEESQLSQIVSATPLFDDELQPPTNVTVVNDYLGVHLSWDAVAGNNITYRIEYSEDGVNFGFLASTDQTSYYDYPVYTLRYYQIFTVRGNLTSEGSEIVQGLPDFPQVDTPVLEIENVAQGALLNITSVDGLVFEIYRSTNGTNFTLYETIKQKMYIDIHVESGTTYYYYVIATRQYWEDSERSNTVTYDREIKQLAQPNLFKAIPLQTGIELVWRHVANYYQYQVFVSTDGTNFTNAGTTSTNSFVYNTTNTNLFYFKVKAISGSVSRSDSIDSVVISEKIMS